VIKSRLGSFPERRTRPYARRNVYGSLNTYPGYAIDDSTDRVGSFPERRTRPYARRNVYGSLNTYPGYAIDDSTDLHFNAPLACDLVAHHLRDAPRWLSKRVW
jgi:hypothetical protein